MKQYRLVNKKLKSSEINNDNFENQRISCMMSTPNTDKSEFLEIFIRYDSKENHTVSLV